MLGEKHDLFHEFPEYQELISELRGSDQEFAGMVEQHDALDNEIRDLETTHQPVADEYFEDLKKNRLMLKDRLYDQLRKHID